MTNNYCDCRQGREPCTCKVVEPVPMCDTPTGARCPGDGVNECKKCSADPVPPAGGEVVIRQYRVVRPDPRDTPYSAWFEIESAEKDDQISASLRFTEGRGEPAVYEVRELVDRAHVTRLQAEVERLTDLCTGKDERMAAMNESWAGCISQRDALQSELTKARELLKAIPRGVPGFGDWTDKVSEYLSNQSPPADKGQDDCAHSEANKHGCPECGEEFKSADKGQGKREGKRERFQKWVLATKHPVLGFLDGHWLARGDDREGYANEYVQGLWVSYKAFATEQTAPVAVVMPECSQTLWLAGKGAPRTCAICGMGPCTVDTAENAAAILAEAREWLGDGKHADGLAREHWTPEYAALIDRIDTILSK